MLSACRGLDYTKEVICRDQEPDGYGYQEFVDYNQRADSRPIMVYYGMIFIDMITHKLYSLQNYTGPHFGLHDVENDIDDPSPEGDLFLSILKKLGQKSRIFRDRAMTDVVSYDNILHDLQADKRWYQHRDMLWNSDPEQAVKFSKNKPAHIEYHINPEFQIEKFEKAQNLYNTLLAIGVDLPEYSEFTRFYPNENENNN